MEPISRVDFEDAQFIEELTQFTAQLAPQYYDLMATLRDGGVVEVSQLQKLIICLHDDVIKYIDKDRNFSDERMLHLEDLLAKMGSQL